MAFVAGPHCEVWVGLWEKGSGEGTSGEKVGGKGVDVEKVEVERVSLGLIVFTPLISLSSGRFESTPNK